MSLNCPGRALAPDAGTTQPADTVIWLHAAFCSMALPMRAKRGTWHRDTKTTSFRIESGSTDEVLPSGQILRLGLLHVCDAAVRTNSPVVDLGNDLSQLAAKLGLDPRSRDLADQWQRLLAVRFLVSCDGGTELSVFDARSRPRAGGPGWRSSVRLNSRFVASLVDHAVPLDRRVVHALSTTPAAFDAYAWIRLCLQRAGADQIITTPWDELLKRFGTASQDAEGFKISFEAALRRVFEVDHSIALAVDDDGVSVRHATQEDNKPPAGELPPAQTNADAEDASAATPAERVAEPQSVATVVAAPAVAKPAENAVSDLGTARRSGSQVGQLARGNVAAAATARADRITQDSISLPRHLTGLPQVIWLRRGHGEDAVLVGVTPTPRFEAHRLTVLAVEPVVLQVSGGLNEQDFERVSAWVMANRDVIDDFWEGRISSFAEIDRRVRKAPAQGWR